VPGTFVPLANRSNDYLMDREKQRAGLLFSGVESIAIQDDSLQESMGPIQDRTREHLRLTDRGIVMARRKLIEAATALREHGVAPPGTEPQVQKVRSVATVLPQDQPFHEATRDALQAAPGKPHVTV
jgi:phthalate 4,5-dioxygenase